MTGYHETFTDPSYLVNLWWLQMHILVIMVLADEVESDGMKISRLILQNFSYNYSSKKADVNLEEFLIKTTYSQLSDVDTEP